MTGRAKYTIDSTHTIHIYMLHKLHIYFYIYIYIYSTPTSTSTCSCDLRAPQTCPSGSGLWLIFPSPREGRQEGGESLPSPVVLRFECPSGVWIWSLAGISEPQRADRRVVNHLVPPVVLRF